MHQHDEMDDDRRAEIEALMSEFENEARKIGCYLQGFAVASTEGLPELDIMGDDGPKMVVMATLLVGEQAFSDRVMNPEKHEEDKEFRTLTADADPFDVLREQMRDEIDQGRNPFDTDDNSE